MLLFKAKRKLKTLAQLRETNRKRVEKWRRKQRIKKKRAETIRSDREINRSCAKLNEPFNRCLTENASKFDAAILAERKVKNRKFSKWENNLSSLPKGLK